MQRSPWDSGSDVVTRIYKDCSLETPNWQRRRRRSTNFTRFRNKVFTGIKKLVTSIMSFLLAVDRNRNALRVRAESAEKALSEATRKAAAEAQQTLKATPNPRSDKRKREMPGDEEELNMHKNHEGGDGRRRNEMPGIGVKKRKRWNTNPAEVIGDVLINQVKGGTSYAVLHCKMKTNPELKAIRESVMKSSHTHKREIVFEHETESGLCIRRQFYRGQRFERDGTNREGEKRSDEPLRECADDDPVAKSA